MVNVLPNNDEQEHVENVSCWCKPEVEWADPESGRVYPNGPLVIHNAADCRELIEQAEEILK